MILYLIILADQAYEFVLSESLKQHDPSDSLYDEKNAFIGYIYSLCDQ